jgi:hypothetical protein
LACLFACPGLVEYEFEVEALRLFDQD